ncbi:hypothetical protein COCSUDRAFT_83478 [Coccomyxa subellipsoidea C-169]|uniref:Dynein axonemal intermediate chain 4 n=1 Tax=Coccomyxa subellipsoidea (strain C-169) TaxID=574566 RepID=I0YVV2_COCSC|nr:hypothetical protein COCSUDRAFT_83478 [Coccomyxa subellipsoidea C-169]EIE22521.1 hypothetical protein COCSUDRAFT_83478 [Coccomyxa subellipsoidea C-169]|eukprot:XP_005647065.1 hypothetical protein COCSUDRAFT_83478 [Coccomyxa subellipsoidea C-169]
MPGPRQHESPERASSRSTALKQQRSSVISSAGSASSRVSHQGTKSFLNDTRASLGPLVRGSVRGSRMTNRGAEPPPSNIHRVLDEDGKDRTPKPLVQRPTAPGYPAGPGRPETLPGGNNRSTRNSRMSSRVSTMSLQLRGSVMASAIGPMALEAALANFANSGLNMPELTLDEDDSGIHNLDMQVHQWEMQGPHATGEAAADPETRQDAFPAAAGHDEEAVGMGTVLEELGLSKTLRPLPAESALDSAKGSGALGRKQTSSRSSAASRRTTQQDPRASMSAQSVMSERASISSARNSYAPSFARSTRQSFVPANSKGGSIRMSKLVGGTESEWPLAALPPPPPPNPLKKLPAIIPVEDLQGYSLEGRWDSQAGTADAASQLADSRNEAPRDQNGIVNFIAGSLDIVWQWAHHLTQGLSVTAMSWNKVNSSILAVGYGQLAFGASQKGSVCVWSLKNPSSPLWAFATPVGVTALDWATNSPNLLALGFSNGTIAVHDARTRQVEPSMQTWHSSGAHSDPVWQLQWVDRGAEAEEVLVSVSTDGRVCQWSTSQASSVLVKREGSSHG